MGRNEDKVNEEKKGGEIENFYCIQPQMSYGDMRKRKKKK